MKPMAEQKTANMCQGQNSFCWGTGNWPERLLSEFTYFFAQLEMWAPNEESKKR
jgi:hypothetical protein